MRLITRPSLTRLAYWSSYPAVLALTVLAFYGLISFGGESADWALLQDNYFIGLVGFTLKQAILSSLISVVLAIPIARALRKTNSERLTSAFLGLCLLCFVTPTLVVVTGLVSLLGHSGWLTPLLNDLSIDDTWNLYGLNGILLAHLFMNMPFAIRIIYLQLSSIPDTSWRLAEQLKLSAWQRFCIIEKPVIQSSGLMLLGFIFVLCFNSFAVVLALGGGPQSTTLEVAVYQALKYDFNIPEALTLAWSQLLIAGGLYAALTSFGSPVWQSHDTTTQHIKPKAARKQGSHTGSHWLNKSLIFAVATVLLLPFIALMPGVQLLINPTQWSIFITPTLTSLGLGVTATAIGLMMAYALLQPIRYKVRSGQTLASKLLEHLATHQLFAPAMVVSVGLFVFLIPRVDLDKWGIVMVIIMNAAVVIPFAFQKIKPRILQFDQQYDRLCQSLKLSPKERWHIEWGFLRPAMISATALVLVFALGDVSIFAIFGPSDWSTLPWLIYNLAGTYRIQEASAASLLLLIINATALWGLERLASNTYKHATGVNLANR